MKAQTPVYKRRHLIVEPGYQLRFVMQLLSIIAAVMVSSFVAASVLMWTQMASSDLGSDSCIKEVLYGIAFSQAITLLIFIPILYVFGIRQTHLVVGPLKRMKKTLQGIGEGDFSQRIILRKGDVLMDLANDINRMAERLNERFPGGRNEAR